MTEFSRPYRLDALAGEPRSVHIDAEPAECGALALRFGIVAIGALAADAQLIRLGEAVAATGTLRATGWTIVHPVGLVQTLSAKAATSRTELG